MTEKHLRTLASIGGVGWLALCWPPFSVIGQVTMVAEPVPLWIRAQVVTFGHAYVVEPRFSFLIVLCAELIAVVLWLVYRKRIPPPTTVKAPAAP